MARLTNDLRDSIHRSIMKGLPVVDYLGQLKKLVQDTILEFAPKQVQELYKNEKTRGYLDEQYFQLSDGNGNRHGSQYWRMYGLLRETRVQMDERVETILVEGSLNHALYHRIKTSGLLEKMVAQDELRDSVSKRLKANLSAATTLNRLYTVLEPELHHFIPKEPEVEKASLPATVAPVVDDLKKLGAVLPEVPKAEGAKA